MKTKDRDLLAAIDSQKWTFAKTYAHFAPHEYFLISQNPKLFKELKEKIAKEGKKEKFAVKPNGGKIWEETYFYLDGYRYWGYDTVLNRTKLKNVKRTKDGVSYPVV